MCKNGVKRHGKGFSMTYPMIVTIDCQNGLREFSHIPHFDRPITTCWNYLKTIWSLLFIIIEVKLQIQVFEKNRKFKIVTKAKLLTKDWARLTSNWGSADYRIWCKSQVVQNSLTFWASVYKMIYVSPLNCMWTASSWQKGWPSHNNSLVGIQLGGIVTGLITTNWMHFRILLMFNKNFIWLLLF